MKNGLLVMVALVGGVIGAGLVWTVDRGAGTDLDSRIHGYLMAHPEVIPEAMQHLQERESGKAVATYAKGVTTPFAGAWAGNPKADVTIVEYYDYNCGYCRASLPMVAKLLGSDSNLRVVYRDMPVLAESSRTAARASLAAATQGRFGKFHDALYAAGPVSDATIRAAATQAGVTFDGVDTKRIDAEIARNLDTASKLGMTGTPSWVIGDRVLQGMLPIEQLQEAVKAARQR